MREIEFLRASEVALAPEAAVLDFGSPNVALQINTVLGASSTSVTLLFLERGGQASYYVKRSSEPSVYVLDTGSVDVILREKNYFLPPSLRN